MALEVAVDHEFTPEGTGYAEAILAASQFHIDVAREPGAVRVCPVGELDVATIEQLRERMDEAFDAAPGRVILDLRETTFLDSTALHLAVDADARADRAGIGFAIVPGPHAVQRTFAAAGLAGRLPFADVPRG